MRLGINKLEIALMLPGLNRRFKKAVDDSGNLDVGNTLRAIGYVFHRLQRAAKKPYKNMLGEQAKAFDTLAELVDIGGQKMGKKFELGITIGEFTAMLPGILSEAWEAYNDDKKISVDEGIELVSFILEKMSEAADDPDVVAFFAAESDALASLAPFFVEDEEPPPEEPVE